MSDFLQFTVDKFTFKIATDRRYNPEGIWAKQEGNRVRIGVSDFFQQHNGDVAFAEMEPVGTAVAAGDVVGNIETIKADVEVPSPVSGVIVEVNSDLEMEAEVVNQDPYGGGWLAVIEPTDWDADQAKLLDPQAYLEHSRRLAEEEVEE